MSVGRAGKAVDDPAAYVKGWGPRETAGAAGEEDRMSGTSGHTPASDDVKRKFREALEKKHTHGGADVSRGGDGGKVDQAHGPETSARQQQFRRKSG